MKLPELQESIPGFEAANELAASIEDQNLRSSRTFVELEDPDFQYVAQESIQQEQAQTLSRLGEYANELPYAKLSERHLSVLNQIGHAAEKLATMRDERDEATRQFDLLADKTIELAPLSEERARQLAEEKKQQHLGSSILEIEQKMADLTAEKAGLEELYLIAGKAWPTPQTPDLDEEADMGETTVILDEIPVEPMLQDGNLGLEGFLERHIDAPAASQYTALYLMEHPERIISVQELYEFLYPPEVLDRIDEYHLRARVTTILGPKKGSLDIQEMLAEEGFVLQFGWRTTKVIGDDDKVVSFSRHRIYRSVPEEQFNVQHLERTVIGDDIYTWETTKEQRDSLLRKSLPDVNGTNGNGEEKPESDLRLSWENDFTYRVESAIENLKERGLMQPGLISTKLISKLAQSKALGTKTAVSRLTDAGILRGTRGKLATELTASQLVAMSIFNPCRTILSKGARQQRALDIIEEKVGAELVRAEREKKAKV